MKDDSAPPAALAAAPWLARLRAVGEVLLASGVVSGISSSLVMAAIFGKERLNLAEMNANLLAATLLLESAITFAILWLLMRTHGETLAGMGLRRSRWKTNVLLGLVMVPLLMLVGGGASALFQVFLPKYVPERNLLLETIRSSWQLAPFIITVLVAGGVKEELQRAFILRRFQRRLGGAGIGLILWSLAFGAYHYDQGVLGVFVATLLGLMFGALYLMRNNLIAPMTAHGVYDTMAVLIYWFFAAK